MLASIAAEAGIRRIHFVAWRDLDDPEAGGSELHAHKIASRWAAAGLDVTFRTSAVPGAPAALTRDGYRVLRQAGRYAVFPGAAWEGIRMGHRPGDALVEIWNGMPFLSPLWYRGPRIVFLHHVHAEMWGMVLPPTLARMGDLVERRIAPRFYRSSRIVTLSESSRDEIVDMLGLRADRVTVAPPGVDARYTPGGQRSPTPLVVAVGRLVPVKRFDVLLRALAEVKVDHPELQAVIIGEGYERPALEALPRRARRHRVGQPAGPRRRRGAGVVVPPGLGGGQQLAARGLGHDADRGRRVRHPGRGHRHRRPRRRRARRRVGPAGGRPATTCAGALGRVLGDEVLRSRLSKGALARSRWFTWDATARRALEALAEEATPAPCLSGLDAGAGRRRRQPSMPTMTGGARCGSSLRSRARSLRRRSGFGTRRPSAEMTRVREQQHDARAR